MVSDWAALLWVCVISFNLFMNVVLEKATDKLEVWVDFYLLQYILAP